MYDNTIPIADTAVTATAKRVVAFAAAGEQFGSELHRQLRHVNAVNQAGVVDLVRVGVVSDYGVRW